MPALNRGVLDRLSAGEYTPSYCDPPLPHEGSVARAHAIDRVHDVHAVQRAVRVAVHASPTTYAAHLRGKLLELLLLLEVIAELEDSKHRLGILLVVFAGDRGSCEELGSLIRHPLCECSISATRLINDDESTPRRRKSWMHADLTLNAPEMDSTPMCILCLELMHP
jgi:hypothetical protein